MVSTALHRRDACAPLQKLSPFGITIRLLEEVVPANAADDAAHIAIAVPILALVVSWLFASIGDITNAMDTNKRLPRPL